MHTRTIMAVSTSGAVVPSMATYHEIYHGVNEERMRSGPSEISPYAFSLSCLFPLMYLEKEVFAPPPLYQLISVKSLLVAAGDWMPPDEAMPRGCVAPPLFACK